MTDTTAGQRARPAAHDDVPPKPRRSRFAVLGALGALALTIATAADWRYGVGLSLADAVENLFNNNPAISAIPDADLGQIFSPRSRQAFVETFQMAVIATLFGGLAALPLAMWATRYGAPNRIVMVAARAFNNVIRAFPDLLWAALFVAAVSVGALAGILALFFFSIAVISKLTADTLDGVDPGPIEAAHASGAGHSQMLRTAVLPQILPAYTSFALYSFELNLRASAVLGFVGAGGIGQRINSFYGLGRWEEVWGLVLMFFLVVFVVEQISLVLRRRLV